MTKKKSRFNPFGKAKSTEITADAGAVVISDSIVYTHEKSTVTEDYLVAAKAEGGEILVADTVRGLCSGKGFLFSDRGEFVAKGFEEPVRLYEVRWSESG